MTSARPDSITCEIRGDTLQMVAELLPAVAAQAAAEGTREPSPADVVALAVAALHTQVFAKAGNILAEQVEADMQAKRGKPVH